MSDAEAIKGVINGARGDALLRLLDRMGMALVLVDERWALLGWNKRLELLATGRQTAELDGIDLRQLVATGTDPLPPSPLELDGRVLLCFSAEGSGKETLRFRVISVGAEVILASEQILYSSSDALADMSRMNTELANLTRALHQRNAALERAQREIKRLQGIIPICSSCKKMRDEDGYWQQVEDYLSERAEVELSHGLCAECFRELYPDFDEMLGEDGEEAQASRSVKARR